MLAKLIAFSLQRSSLVIVLAAGFLIYAGFQLPKMPVDVFPELNAPTVVILTEAGGLAPDEVEQYVSFPIESSVNGLPGVHRVRSASATGLSLVWAEFDWGADVFRARQMVSERLSAIRETLPPNAHAEITPITSITGEIMLLAVSSPDGSISELDLRAIAEFDLRQHLLAVPGVAQVIAIGGALPEYRVDVKQERLALYDLTMQDVITAVAGAHSTATAGYLADIERQEWPIRQEARIASIEGIRSTLVRLVDGAPITVSQVAEVSLAGAPKRGAAADNGKPAVVLSIQKSPGTNTLELTKRIDESLDQFEKALPAGARLNRAVFRQSDFIKRSVDNVMAVLRDAVIIVAIIIVLFLMNLRATVITLVALPLSIAAALLILYWQGLTINVMTLGGLAVAIGELVDDAIIDVENVFRRLRENNALPIESRRSHTAVIYDASNEIRSSVVFATILIVVVFLPLMFLQGLEGRFFRPLGITYVTSILASLVIALTVTPAMCKYLFRGKLGGTEHVDGRFVRVLKRAYAPLLRFAIRRRWLVLGASFALMILALMLGSTFGTSFLPEFNEGTFTVFLNAPPGTSLQESDRTARGVESRLTEIEGVRSVTRRTGRAERDEHAEPPSSSEIEVTVAAGFDKAEVRRRIDAVIADVPGITTSIGQPIEHRLSHVLSGTPAAIAINVFGEDLSTLRGLAKEIEAALKSTPGTRDVAANREVLVTSLPIRYRNADLAAAGLTHASTAEQVEDALWGRTVAVVNQGVRRFDVSVRLAADERSTVEDVESVMLRGSAGARVRLSDVASIGPERTSSLITRENARRKAVITCNVADGANLGDLVEVVRARVDPIVAAAGCTVGYGGQFEAQQSAGRTLLWASLGVIVIMFLLLQLSTGSMRAAGLVMLNLPLALIGGVVAVFVSSSRDPAANFVALLTSEGYIPPVASIATIVGFVTLFGIAVRNGILLVNHYSHLIDRENETIGNAVFRGSMERLVPILMTAFSAALGLLPLAWAAGEPGSELLAPLAVVVLGGLASSTILNLYVVPAGYSLFFDRRRARAATDGDGARGVAPEVHQ